MAILLMFACNDAHGNPQGWADSVTIDEGITLQGGRITISHALMPVRGCNPAMEGNQTLRFGQFRIPCFNYQTWAGNWCWDAVSVGWPAALRALNYLAAKRDWHCEEAPAGIFEAFNERHKVTPQEWKRKWNDR
jgi:hypothetical protein